MVNEQEKAAKHWLRELRSKSGLSQRALAELVGTSRRTILNAESIKEDAGWPNGFTLYRMLQELGAVEDSPTPGDSPVARVEAKVDGLAKTLDDVAAIVREHLPDATSQGQANEG